MTDVQTETRQPTVSGIAGEMQKGVIQMQDPSCRDAATKTIKEAVKGLSLLPDLSPEVPQEEVVMLVRTAGYCNEVDRSGVASGLGPALRSYFNRAPKDRITPEVRQVLGHFGVIA